MLSSVMTAVTCEYANVPIMSIYANRTAVFNHVHQKLVSFWKLYSVSEDIKNMIIVLCKCTVISTHIQQLSGSGGCFDYHDYHITSKLMLNSYL